MLVAAWFLAGVLGSCQKEDRWLTEASAMLDFSSDTVAFDTVFTTLGTTTQVLMVYNPYDEAVRIDNITLQKGWESRFRLNVDGDSSMVVRNKMIEAHDSMFVFVRACLNPNSALEPFLVEDAIVFDFNGKDQKVVLTAYGRNAVYHTPDHSIHDAAGNPIPYSVIDCENWDHSRPHVIMGYAVVDEGDVLHLQPGETLYFGNNSYLWVYDGGSLDARGAQGNPVVFTSMRQDGYYDELPGQWGYIWLSTGSIDNVVDWARIENGTVGLVVDTNVNGRPTLKISNSMIENFSTAGIVGQGSIIKGDNLLIDNCGIASLSLQYGGDYLFSNSTFADYWNYDARTNGSVILNNHYDYFNNDGILVAVYPRDLRRAEFRNCIIYGSYSGLYNEGEIEFQNNDEASFNVSFDHCLLRTGFIDSAESPESKLIINRDPCFLNPREQDYHLLPESPAIGAGTMQWVSHPNDLEGRVRENPPSIGIYEYCDTSLLKHYTFQTCTTTSRANWQKSLPPMRSLIARGSAIFLKSPSIRIPKSKTAKK